LSDDKEEGLLLQ
jgi:hypothetical protein